jgi:hypothetical protein
MRKIEGLVLIIGIMILMALPLCSAVWDWDNVQKYNEETRTYTISNALGLPKLLGGGKIAKLTLNTPKYNRVFDRGDGVMQKVAEFTIENYYNGYPNTFKQMEFFHRANMRAFQRDFEYRYRAVVGTKQVPDTYEKICNPYLDINGSINQNCRIEVATYKTGDIIDWLTLNHSEDLPEGNITIGIFTDVQDGDYVEWIPTFFGERLVEWASWSVGLNNNLLFYITANETVNVHSLNVTDVVHGTHNVSLIAGAHTGTGGKIGNGIIFDGVNDEANITDQLDWANLSSNDLQGFTISAWLQADNDDDYILDSINAGGNSGFLLFTQTGKCKLHVGTSGSNVNVLSNQSCTAKGLFHWVGVWNGTTIYQYVNGTLQNHTALINTWANSTTVFLMGDEHGGGGQLTGVIDELAMWNRTLTASEISDLWNNGAGITYKNFDVPPMEVHVQLRNPVDNHETMNTSQVFESNYTIENGNLTNATVYVWNSNHTLFKTNTTTAINGTTNSSNLTISNFVTNNYLWNVYACAGNITGNECSFASANRTLEIQAAIVNSQTYNSTILETETGTFILNFSSNDSSPVVRLNYNGTFYPTTTTAKGDEEWESSKFLLINQSVTGSASELRQFYFEINASEDFVNSTFTNQTVEGMNLTICSYDVNNTYINFTFKNEGDSTYINASIDTSTFSYYLTGESSTNEKVYTHSDTTDYNNFSLCFSPEDRSMDTNITLQYSSSGYPQRRYTRSTQTYANTTTELTLYLTATADGSYSTYQVQDSTGSVIDGVSVTAERQISGTWTLIESGTTDSAGSVTFWLNPDYDHRLTFTKTGYTSVQVTIRPSQSIYTVTMETSGVDADYQSSLEGIKYFTYPPSGRLSEGTHLFGFNVTSSVYTLSSCKIEIVNETTSLNSSTGGSGASCNLSVALDVTPYDELWGKYYINIGEGLFLIDADNKWKIQNISKPDRGTIYDFIKNIQKVDNFGKDAEGEFSRIVWVFLIMMLTLGVISKTTGWDLISDGGLLWIFLPMLWILSVPGFLEIRVINLDSFAQVNKYFVAFLATCFIGGFALNDLAKK